ncbi:hypothetical protein [Arcticibacter tournemirensis]
MKIKVALVIFCLLLSYNLVAQKQIDEYGVIIPELETIKEKKELTAGEFASTFAPYEKGTLFEFENSDTLLLDGRKYSMFQSPIQILFNKAFYILYDDSEIAVKRLFVKRYILTWELKNDSLYIVDYCLAPSYHGTKTKEDIIKDIHKFWGKRFENGRLKADWMVLYVGDQNSSIELFVRDDQINVSSLMFKGGKFIKIKERNDLILRKAQIRENSIYTSVNYQPWIDKMRRMGFSHMSISKTLESLGTSFPELLTARNN